MKYIVTPGTKKDQPYCPAEGNCGNYSNCPGYGNGNNTCKEVYITLCALCSEDPRFCGPNTEKDRPCATLNSLENI